MLTLLIATLPAKLGQRCGVEVEVGVEVSGVVLPLVASVAVVGMILL